MSTPSALRQLSDLISQTVGSIDKKFADAHTQYPDINTPFSPSSAAETLSMDPSVIGSATLIVSACAQLSAMVNLPALTLYDAVGAFHVSSALRVALEANVVEILRQYPDGLHVKDIASKNHLEAVKLARVLRLLATHHIFREVSPDVFCNNRLSSMMDTHKSVDDILANPIEKHTGTPGVAALMEHTADECMKSSAYLTENLLDRSSSESDTHNQTALSLAFNTDKMVFDWYEEPGNEFRLKRFAAAMEGAAKLDPPHAVLNGFDWSILPDGSVVVDVGGGLGHAVHKIYQRYPKLKFVIQDRPKVVQEAQFFWKNQAMEALTTGAVVLQEHDFFQPQKVQNASIFMCGMIFHDYGKRHGKIILNHLRSVASTDTKLLIIDQIVPYACSSKTTEAITKGIKGAEQLPAPPPLLPNLGKANAIAYLGDFQMLSTNGGEERTLGSFINLLQESGWRIVQIFTIPGSIHKQILAIPISS